MAQTSDELRDEIEHTRDEMGDTVDALAYKADVPTRTKDWLEDKKEAVVAKVSGTSSKVGERTPDGDELRRQARRLRTTAEHNPLGLAVAGAAAGFIAGLLAPSTRFEDERIGEVADDVKSEAVEAGREAVDRGKTVVQEAGQTAVETARETGREQGEELAASLQEKARQAMPQDESAGESERPLPSGR